MYYTIQMSNFKLIKSNINVDVFLKELEQYLKNKEWETKRAQNIKVQENTKSITLRQGFLGTEEGNYQDKDQILKELMDSDNNELHKNNYKYFKKTYEYLEKFADDLDSQLSTVIIATLSPKKRVHPHIDSGNYYKKRDRYHIPIKTNGSINICGGETQEYKTGELWWFDNKKVHEAYNDSDEDRIHIIFDILPKKRNFMKKIIDYIEKKRAEHYQ